MIYVQAFVGLLVLTVSVLSNGNNYGALSSFIYGIALGGERPGDGGEGCWEGGSGSFSEPRYRTKEVGVLWKL